MVAGARSLEHGASELSKSAILKNRGGNLQFSLDKFTKPVVGKLNPPQ